MDFDILYKLSPIMRELAWDIKSPFSGYHFSGVARGESFLRKPRKKFEIYA